MPDDSSVERLKKKLYTRGAPPEQRERRELEQETHSDDVSGNWVHQEDIQEQQELENNPEKMLEQLREGRISSADQAPAILRDERVKAPAGEVRQQRRVASRLIRTMFIASAAFFLLAVGIAGYFFLAGKGTVSCTNVTIDVGGPVSIASGKELVLSIGITNGNPVTMQNVGLTVDYPEGTRNPENSSISLPFVRQEVGVLEPGEATRATARAVLFGKEHTESTIDVTVDYQIDGADAVISCEAVYPILIATAPVSLTVDGLEEISSGQQLDLTITLTSNSDEMVPNLRLVADYPFGFEFVDAKPAPTNGLNAWDLGDIAEGTQQTITLTGIVSAQSAEARSIKFEAGSQDRTDDEALATILQAVDHPLLITRPFLALDVEIDGSTASEVSAVVGDTIHGILAYSNTLQYPIYDVEIEAVLPAALVDNATVKATGGFYRSVDQTMLWTPQTDSRLEVVEPGETGKIRFTFKTKTFIEGSSVSEPAINLEFAVHARRVSDDIPVQETLLSQAPRTIKLLSDLEFTPYAVYGIGPFSNAGPHPPRVDEETTYTIVWNVKNTTNNIDGVQVQGELPVYVKWLDRTDPNDESVSYNPNTHLVTWDAGEVLASTGIQLPEREIAFQVSLIPSISQENRRINIVEDMVIRGVDRFTGDVIQHEVNKVDTNLTKDPYFPSTRGGVTE